MDNDGRETTGGDPEEGIGETVEGDNDDNGCDNSSNGSADTRLGLEGGAGEGASGWVGSKDRANSVGDTNGDGLLIRVNLVTVETAEGCGFGLA